MSRITRTNPPGLHGTPGYHHVTVVTAGPVAYLAGQCPLDPSGAVVGVDDIGQQVDRVALNARVALAAAGAAPPDVVKSVIYVVSDDRDVLASVWQRFTSSPIGAAFTSASTLLGVAALGFPGQLVELDLIAALGD